MQRRTALIVFSASLACGACTAEDVVSEEAVTPTSSVSTSQPTPTGQSTRVPMVTGSETPEPAPTADPSVLPSTEPPASAPNPSNTSILTAGPPNASPTPTDSTTAPAVDSSTDGAGGNSAVPMVGDGGSGGAVEGSGGNDSFGEGGVGGGATMDLDARRFILRDEGLSRLTYVDLGSPGNGWSVVVPAGRDLQLIGDERVLIGTENGLEERSLADGSKLGELSQFGGTVGAQRLADGRNLLVGVDWQNQSGITLVLADDDGNVTGTINYPGYGYVRLVRPTASGTYLVTADTQVFEGDLDGNIVWQATITGHDEPHAWTALRLADGNTVVATGYAASLQVFSPDEQLVDTFTGPSQVNPYFYSGLQVLDNGHFLVANWQGHGEGFGTSGQQLVEYDAAGNFVWAWQQDAALVSSLQAVVALDGLDTSRLHVIGDNGQWIAAP